MSEYLGNSTASSVINLFSEGIKAGTSIYHDYTQQEIADSLLESSKRDAGTVKQGDDNTMLYVGLGVGGVLLLVTVVVLMRR